MKNAIFEIWSRRLWMSRVCRALKCLYSSNHRGRRQAPFFGKQWLFWANTRTRVNTHTHTHRPSSTGNRSRKTNIVLITNQTLHWWYWTVKRTVVFSRSANMCQTAPKLLSIAVQLAKFVQLPVNAAVCRTFASADCMFYGYIGPQRENWLLNSPAKGFHGRGCVTTRSPVCIFVYSWFVGWYFFHYVPEGRLVHWSVQKLHEHWSSPCRNPKFLPHPRCSNGNKSNSFLVSRLDSFKTSQWCSLAVLLCIQVLTRFFDTQDLLQVLICPTSSVCYVAQHETTLSLPHTKWEKTRANNPVNRGRVRCHKGQWRGKGKVQWVTGWKLANPKTLHCSSCRVQPWCRHLLRRSLFVLCSNPAQSFPSNTPPENERLLGGEHGLSNHTK